MPQVKKPSQQWTTRAVAGLIAATMACFALIGAGVAQAGAVLSNGTVELGVNDAGQLNFGNRGVYYVATAHDGTRAGCPCEGWGAGNEDQDPAKRFSGYANQSQGVSGVTQESFTSDAMTATSTTSVGNGRLRVEHEFAPFAGSEDLYEVKVTLTNLTDEALGDVRYTRLMDWDIEPTPFSEFVTVRRGTTPALLFSNDNGFESNDPLRESEPSPQVADTQNVDFTDSGPTDHGALFDFGFGALDPGESTTFTIFYGAAGTTADADAAISAAGAELYSYGKPNNGGAPNNALNTFIFGFRGLGGRPIIPPKLTLTPKLAATDIDTPHTVTLLVRDSALDAVPGAPVAFGVTGANPRADTSVTTDAAGEATFTYTGTVAGRDTIRACLDGDGDGVCSSTEVTVRARVDYEDPIQPKTLIDSGPADEALIADATPTFEFSASTAESTYECRVDADEFALCTSPVTLDLSDGEHTFEVRATAGANTDASAETRTFTVDTTAPQTTIDAGPADGAAIADSTPAFEFSSDEPGSTFVCVVDDGDPLSCDSPYVTDELADAEHTFTVTAVDPAGNVDPAPELRTFSVDTIAPQTTIDAAPVDGSVITDSTPVFEFTSNEPGSTFECSIDGGAFSCDSPFTPDGLADGPHTIAVTAADAAGNADPSPASRAFTVDTAAPQTTISSGPADGATTPDSTPAFAFASSEASSTFACRVDAEDFAPCASGLSTAALGEGEHTFSVRATDAGGNTDPSPASRTFTVDTTAPQTTISSGPANGATTADSTPTFEFSSGDGGATFACSIDGGGTFACESPFTPSALADGAHTFAVTAADEAGNTDPSPASRTFTVDTTAPQTAVGGGPQEGATTSDSTPAFAFSSDAPGSTFECIIDGGAAFACQSPYTPAALADGEHTFSVTATDSSGNRDASPTIRRFTVDTRPVPVALVPPSSAPADETAPAAPEALLPCVSRRRFSITLRPARVRLVSAVVRVNHKRVAIRKSSRRLRATVDLRGLAKATYAVTIDARDARRHHYRETRRYRVC